MWWLLLVPLLHAVSQQINVTVLGRLVAGGTGGSVCDTTGTEADHLVEPVDVAVPAMFPGLGWHGAARGPSPRELEMMRCQALGPAGVLILDKACSRVTQAPLTGVATGGSVVAGGSIGSFANSLFFPEALAYDDSTGDLYIADGLNHRVMLWQLGGASGTEMVSGGPSTAEGKLVKPTGLALADGMLYVVEGNLRVQRFEVASCCGTPSQAVGSILMGCEPQDIPCFVTGSYAVDSLRADPGRLAVWGDVLYVADTQNHRILQLQLNGTESVAQVVAGTTGIAGCRPEQLNLPEGVAVDSNGFLFVADTGNHRIQKFAVLQDRRGLTVAGECCCPRHDATGPLGGASLAQLNGPKGLAIDASGALLVADTGNQRVVAFGGSGHESFSSKTSSCAFGVACQVRLFGMVRSFNKSQVVIVSKEPTGLSPCGSKNCSFAHWPGMTNPQVVGGTFLDTFDLGMPHGPANASVAGVGEFALCWAEAPSTACVGYSCSQDDSCSNSTAWLCNGAQPLGLVRKVWYNIGGKTLDDLRSAPAFPALPDLEEFRSAFSSPQNQGENYGQLFYGLFVAPETGTYTFQITSDENSELRISSTFNDTVGEVVAYISEAEVWYDGPFPRYGYAPSPDAWDIFPTQKGTYYMEAGHLYYVEALHKERVQADHFLVGVTLPSGTTLRPIPASYFDAKICTSGFPKGLAVVHDCANVKTGQSCTGRCQGGWSGAEQAFLCDGTGTLRGTDPICTAVQCEEYSLEIGSLFMHGVWDEVDCSNMEGQACDAQLLSWAGPENCAYQARTDGTCREYCASRGRGCVKSSVEVDACCVKRPGDVTTTPTEGSCDTVASEQICVCGRVEQSSNSVCLLSAWCSQGLMTPGSSFWGASSDENGDLIVVDSMRSVVVRWTGLQYQVLAGGNGIGTALDQLNKPLGAYYVPGSPGVLYVADTVNHRVVAWSEGDAVGSKVFGTGSPGRSLSELRFPAAVYFNQSLFVVDYGNSRVLLASGLGRVLTEEEVRELPLIPGTAGDSFFDDLGNFYRVDYGSHRLNVCFRESQCSFACKDVDPVASYGPSCGCQEHTSCREAMGAL